MTGKFALTDQIRNELKLLLCNKYVRHSSFLEYKMNNNTANKSTKKNIIKQKD